LRCVRDALRRDLTTFNVRQACGASRNGRTRQTSAASHFPLTSYHLVVALALEPNSPSSRGDNHRHVRRRATRESQNVTEVQYDFLSYAGEGMGSGFGRQIYLRSHLRHMDLQECFRVDRIFALILVPLPAPDQKSCPQRYGNGDSLVKPVKPRLLQVHTPQ